NRVLEIARDVSPYIQPHDVHQAITGAVGKADQRPGERVDFFDRVLVFYRDPLDRSPEEAADPVGDEVGCVLTTNNSFAQMNVTELRDELDQIGISRRTGNHLDQTQITWRIEEVSSEKMTPLFLTESFRDPD